MVLGPEDPTEEQERQSAAYHEAGHAAVLRHFGIDILSITIVSGHEVLAENLPDDFHPESTAADLELAKQHIIVYHAGKAAEMRACGTTPTAIDGDLVLAFKIAALILGEDVDHPRGASFAYVDALCSRATELLDRPEVWANVEALAGALLEKGTLSGEDVARVLAAVGGLPG